MLNVIDTKTKTWTCTNKHTHTHTHTKREKHAWLETTSSSTYPFITPIGASVKSTTSSSTSKHTFTTRSIRVDLVDKGPNLA